MPSFLDVSIDFSRSHLIFPTLIFGILTVLLVAILTTRRAEIVTAISATPHWPAGTDKPRLFGTVLLVVVYFLAMQRIGYFFPNLGFGFLFASTPFVFLISVLYMNDRTQRSIVIALLNAVICPLVVWFILSNLFNISLP